MKIVLATATLALLAGCALFTQQEELCDRQNIVWDKYGTAEIPQSCSPRVAAYLATLPCCSDRPETPETPTGHPPPPKPPETPEPPTSKPPTGHPPPPKPPTSTPPETSKLGNPGNDKPVGRSGEKKAADMAERGEVGNRGKSN